jgi:hypothetical protein
MQLATKRTIHCAQGLTLDHLAFDLSGVTKHGLIYITLSRIKCKDNLYLLSPLFKNNFHVYPIVQEEMTCFRRDAKYELSFVLLQNFRRKTIIIQSLNIRSLKLHFLNLLIYWNIMASHILCLNEKKIIYIYRSKQ